MLELHQVTLRAGARALLEDVSLRLSPGDFVAVVGPNGAGKTTLLRTALGLLRPDSGTVALGGGPLAALSELDRAARLAWLPQRVVVTEPVTALEWVATARYRFREGRAGSLDAARRALERVGGLALAERPLPELSGGEQQRVAIAAVLAQEAPLVLLDEPASYLDPAQQIALYTLVGELWRSGLGVLCVTHDVNALAHAAGGEGAARMRIVGMSEGRIQFVLPYDSVELADRLGGLFGVEVRAVELAGGRLFASVGLGGRS